LLVGRYLTTHANELPDHAAELRIVRADVHDGSPVGRIGQAIQRGRARLHAAGSQRADGGVVFHFLLAQALLDLLALRENRLLALSGLVLLLLDGQELLAVLFTAGQEARLRFG